MRENYEEFISLILRTRILRRPSRMLARNWKHQWLTLCLARSARHVCNGDPWHTTNEIKSKLACILEASEFTRLRMEESLPKYHEDHIAGKGDNSVQHKNVEHKFIPMLQAMKIPAAKAAVDKGWEKLENISAWNLTKVSRWSKDKGRKSSFCLTDGHLSFEECWLKTRDQKYRGRVVLRGDTVKDDTGSYAAFTEQGSSASQMTAAKVMDIISRLPGCSGQAADAVSANTRSKWKVLRKYYKFPNRTVQTFGFVYHDTWKIQAFFLRETFWIILWQDYYGKGNLRKSFYNMVGIRSQLGVLVRTPWKRVILICVCGWHQIGWKETKHWSDVESTQ